MKKRRTSAPRSRSGSKRSTPHWIGARIISPFYITEGTPYRPELTLWLEFPDRTIVHFHLRGADDPPVSFGDSLLTAMKAPELGPPRRPDLIRVAGADLAAEVRRVAPDIPVVEGPTPEIWDLLEQVADFSGEGEVRADEPSYFENGRVSKETVEALFAAASLLNRVAPWEVAADQQVVRVDIPQYGIEAGCLSIIGALGESMGLLLFPSQDAFELFLEAARDEPQIGPDFDMGTSWRSLTLEPASELPDRMRREALEHGWSVDDVDAYPLVQHRDSDGVARPLSEDDVRIMSACALSFCSFFLKHRTIFEEEELEPVCEAYFNNNELEVRFTVPYEAGEFFAVNDPKPAKRGRSVAPSATEDRRSREARGTRDPFMDRPAPAASIPVVGRNQPCPCGSGKKYKLCCLDKQAKPVSDASATRAKTRRGPSSIHELDGTVVSKMDGFARTRFGTLWMRSGEGIVREQDGAPGLLGPWMLHVHPFDGKPVREWFLEARSDELPEDERAWLESQRTAWFSVWEVLEVDPGSGVVLKDLLTGEIRDVWEASGSEALVRREAVLGRIIDHEDYSVICGLHPRPLRPGDAARVVERVRNRLHRRSKVPTDRLRDEALGRFMIACWDEAVEEAEARALRIPELRNTDGERLVETVDHFVFELPDRAEIQRRLAALEQVEDPPEPDDPEQEYVFTKPGNGGSRGMDSTVIGRAIVSGITLRLEANSVERADALRSLLEKGLGSLIRHHAREHTDLMAALKQRRETGRPSRGASPPLSSPEIDQAILEMKTKHYSDWADHPIPALGGKTPRAAARTKAGREKVDLLLKESENMESRLPEGQRYDFGWIRQDLGLEC